MIGSNRTARTAQLLLSVLIAAVWMPTPAVATRLPDTGLHDSPRDAPQEIAETRAPQHFRLFALHVANDYDTPRPTYDGSPRNFLQPDPLGPVDSTNLYQAFPEMTDNQAADPLLSWMDTIRHRIERSRGRLR